MFIICTRINRQSQKIDKELEAKMLVGNNAPAGRTTQLANFDPALLLKDAINAMKMSVHIFFSDVTDMIVDAIRDIPDFRPLPNDLDYSYCLISYIWHVVFMSAKTLGHRAARLYIIHVLLESLFYYSVLIVITYFVLPFYSVLMDRKTDPQTFPIVRRRMMLIALAFIFGLLSEHIWIHWLHTPNVEPSYYFPVIVGLSFQIVGPFLANDRRFLLLGTVGLSTIISIATAARFGLLGPKYILGAIICAIQSGANFQMLLGELRRRKPDEYMMTSGHFKPLLISLYTHALLTLINAKYDPLSINEADID